MVHPPSTAMFCPVRYDASGKRRNPTTFATSSGRPMRPKHGHPLPEPHPGRILLGIFQVRPSGVDDSRRDSIDAHSFPAIVDRHRPGQAEQGTLGGDVGGVVADAVHPLYRGDEYDRPFVLFAHDPGRVLRDLEGPVERDRHDGPPLLVGLGGRAIGTAGVGRRNHQAIERAEVVNRAATTRSAAPGSVAS